LDDEPSLCLRLIELGADVTIATNDSQLTALHFAARYSELDLVERIIDAGGDVNAADARGWTPLHEAVMVGYLSDVVASLMVAGADPHRQNAQKVTCVELVMAWEKMAKEGALSYKNLGKPFNYKVPLREIKRLREILILGSTNKNNVGIIRKRFLAIILRPS